MLLFCVLSPVASARVGIGQPTWSRPMLHYVQCISALFFFNLPHTTICLLHGTAELTIRSDMLRAILRTFRHVARSSPKGMSTIRKNSPPNHGRKTTGLVAKRLRRDALARDWISQHSPDTKRPPNSRCFLILYTREATQTRESLFQTPDPSHGANPRPVEVAAASRIKPTRSCCCLTSLGFYLGTRK